MRFRAAPLSLAIVFASGAALAQSGPRLPLERPTSTTTTSHSLRAHFGAEVAKRLLDSGDAATRLRGIDRAADVGTPDAVALLVSRVEKSAFKSDAREALAVVRALGRFLDQAPVRGALETVVTSTMVSSGRLGSAVDPDPGARFDLARSTAALLLVRSGDAPRITKLVKLVQLDGTGADAVRAALAAVRLPPAFTFETPALSSPSVITLVAKIGDARSVPALRNSAHSPNAATRAAALEALAELGDVESIPSARDALADHSPLVRVAGARALAVLGVPERFKAIAALVDDDATAAPGIALAETTQDLGVVKALAKRAAASTSLAERRSAIAALGRGDSVDALRALGAVAKDPLVAFDVARALSTSPSPGAMAVIEKLALDPQIAGLGVRAYVVRRAAFGKSSSALDHAIEELRASKDGEKRALGTFAALVGGHGDVDAALSDRDARVRRAAVFAFQDERFAGDRTKLVDRFAHETDEGVRALSLIGLADRDARLHLPTTVLDDRARSAGGDAPLAVWVRAARKTEDADEVIAQLLRSPEATVRAHAARGLAESAAPDATGLLANAYLREIDPDARRAIVVALAAATPVDAEIRTNTLKLAAFSDPDAEARLYAGRALAGVPTTTKPAVTQIAWLSITTNDGSKPPPGMLGNVVRSDGLALPVVFDDDGFALVPNVPPGEARLVLAPRFVSDEDAKKR